jgi:hypothetical protein
MKRFNIRKVVGSVMIGIGAVIILYYIPLWAWYVILGVLLLLFIYTLIRIYL